LKASRSSTEIKRLKATLRLLGRNWSGGQRSPSEGS
jgi:hypothetical protein